MPSTHRTDDDFRAAFSGLWIPLVTPFTADAAQVDHAALRALVQGLSPQGVAGFAACGSTGEAAALTTEEQLAVLDTTIEAAGGLPVLMGIGGYNLAKALAMVRLATTRPGAPVAGLLVAAPCYIRPSQQGLLHWFGALADASPVPIMVYDVPARTGVQIELATMLRLASHPRIQGLKDCASDAAKTAALLADGRLQLLTGNDAEIFTAMAQGASGAMSASAHLHTARIARVIALLADGQLAEARRLWLPLQPWVAGMFAEPNPAPIKAMLARRGLMAPTLRAPMDLASAELVHALAAIDEALSPGAVV